MGELRKICVLKKQVSGMYVGARQCIYRVKTEEFTSFSQSNRTFRNIHESLFWVSKYEKEEKEEKTGNKSGGNTEARGGEGNNPIRS